MNENYIKNVVEAALLAAGRPLQLTELVQLFDESARPEPAVVRAALDGLTADYESRGIEVKETATGFRIQVRREMANEVSRLWPERPPKYSRALLETLALIAYRQPITRAEIEAVRGVAVNPNIIKTVLERNWVKVVGTRDVPGRPELLGTTREFLDYFGLKSLEDLPPLAELKAMGEINLQLDLAKPSDESGGGSSEGGAGTGGAGAGGADRGAVPAAAAAVAVAAVASAATEADAPSEAVASEVVTAEAPSAPATAKASTEPTAALSEPVSAEVSAELPVAQPEASSPPDVAEPAVATAVAAPDENHAALSEPATVDAPIEPALVAQTDASSPPTEDQPELVAPEPEVALTPLPEEALIDSDPHYTVEHDIAADTLTHIEIESDPGDVTVEVEALSLVESRIEASIESDDEPAPAATADAAAQAAPTKHDQSIETGEFELSELGMTRGPGSLIEAEFDAEDLEASAADDDSSDDEEELSASPNAKSGLVAAPRDRDD